MVKCLALPLTLGITALASAAESPTFEVPAGNYTVTAQMIMPHLDEMRRISTTEQRCIIDQGPIGLFPVMDQPALRGCNLGFGRFDGTAVTYLLVCQTARVATGTATLHETPSGIAGTVDVKMGGKNMTFSQRIAAVHKGDCGEN